MKNIKRKNGNSVLLNQVTSLELSKKLKELGVKQESLWYWVVDIDGKEKLHYADDITNFEYEEMFSAFTVAELGEMLPNYVYTVGAGGSRHSQRVDYVVGENLNTRELWAIAIAKGFKRDELPFEVRDKTEANARAKMLIYLLENKLIK